MKLVRICLALYLMAAPAAAQQMPFQAPAQPSPYAVPAQAPFPQLPPSRSCTTQELVGVWKLMHVYEAPTGLETTAFITNPAQYIIFNPDSTYGKYAGNTDVPPVMIRGAVAKQSAGLQQYLVDTSGIVFFYQNGASTDSQACFIVANPLGEFIAGQLLLMPPEGTIKGRLVKTYARVNEQPVPPQWRGGR